jgi:NADH dehydrogenase (ubiquinone) 1 alpha subcomplex subunit 10
MLSKLVNINLLTVTRTTTVLPQILLTQTKRNFSRDEIGKRTPNPWDYNKKPYGIWGQIVDPTTDHLNRNSLIITVDGNFGAGKTEFAKNLAKEIDFVYASEPDLQKHLFLMKNGFDFRELINKLTDGNDLYHIDSSEDWHRNPSFKSSAQVQVNYYTIRWMQMRTALIHLFSTGQGVVLERSPWSDNAIATALYENLMLSEEAFVHYKNELTYYSISDLWKPHLCIYLDRSPEKCLQTIKQKGKVN